MNRSPWVARNQPDISWQEWDALWAGTLLNKTIGIGFGLKPGPPPETYLLDRYLAAAIQIDMPSPKSRLEIGPRVQKMLAMVEQCAVGYQPLGDVKLVVFPEFAHTPPVYAEKDDLIKHLAVSLPNEHTEAYQRKARELDLYIQTGTFLEVDPAWPGHVFNTTCLIGPEGIVASYRKVYPWLPWEVHTSPADLSGYDRPLFPVADTPIGKLGVAICYDWLFAEAIRSLALNGAEVLIRVSAYMDPWGATAPMDWWTVVNRCRALENTAYVVACNQGAAQGHYPPFSWPGGSMIVDFDGRILTQADPGPGDKIVVATIDLAVLRHERNRRQMHRMLDHLKPCHRQRQGGDGSYPKR